ncbi:hypothetical protein FOL47_008596 [Perkinsus chesapeaki]|uniref:Uncharacterized protein n=1 Tax=Perkinsus chesapeaki TaxID=330153 RepID=A0A7J6MTB6_PERCH|nr:hypothetical protein FOL47_008596 [Perkinsus chesapeaki]
MNNMENSTIRYGRDSSTLLDACRYRSEHTNPAEPRAAGNTPHSGVRRGILNDNATPKVHRHVGGEMQISTEQEASVGTSTAPLVRTRDAATSLFSNSGSGQLLESIEQSSGSSGRDSVAGTPPRATPKSTRSPIDPNITADYNTVDEEASKFVHGYKKTDSLTKSAFNGTAGKTSQVRDTIEATGGESEEIKPREGTADESSEVSVEQHEGKVMTCNTAESERQNNQETTVVVLFGKCGQPEIHAGTSDTIKRDVEEAELHEGSVDGGHTDEKGLNHNSCCDNDCEIEDEESNLEDAPQVVEWIPASSGAQCMIDPNSTVKERIPVERIPESPRASGKVRVPKIAEEPESDTRDGRSTMTDIAQASARQGPSQGAVLWKAHARESIHIEASSSSSSEDLKCQFTGSKQTCPTILDANFDPRDYNLFSFDIQRLQMLYINDFVDEHDRGIKMKHEGLIPTASD